MVLENRNVVLGVIKLAPVTKDLDLVRAFFLPKGNAALGCAIISSALTLSKSTLSIEAFAFGLSESESHK